MNDIIVIQNKIYEIRGLRVMLDRDLATLYGVTTSALNQAVKRNIKRFPDDFMFQLTNQEFANLKSQIVTSSWGGIRKLPYAFTEHGVAMLSGLLKQRYCHKRQHCHHARFCRHAQLHRHDDDRHGRAG